MGLHCKAVDSGRNIVKFLGKDVLFESGGPISEKKREVEQLWKEFFSNPSQWRDHRMGKVNPRFPDFKHKKTQESLWLDSRLNPPWVEARLARIAPRTLESSISSWNQEHVPPIGASRNKVENHWRELFSNPSEWQDHRLGKVNPRFPDFQNLKTQQALWLNCKWIPPWVEAKLAAMAPGIMKSSNVAWNQRLSVSAKAGKYKEALDLYEHMQQDGITTNAFTFCPVLLACTCLGDLEQGRRIHSHITQKGLESDLFVGSRLIDMYGKCGSIEEAERVFNRMQKRDVVTWNAMIQGNVKCGQAQKALELYRQMQKVHVDPNPVTFVAVLNACATVAALEEGRGVHDLIMQRCHEANVFVQSSLVDMYGKCGSIEDAERVFKEMPTKNVAVWNAMIQGYVKCGEGQKALTLYEQMQHEVVDPDPITFVAVLNACASVVALGEGRGVHEVIIQRGHETNVFVRSSLVDMYGKCGSIEDAERVFKEVPTRHVVAWNAMIHGYVKCGEGQKALELYRQMQQDRMNPNPVTFVAVLNACASVGALEDGRSAHEEIIHRGYEADDHVSNCLIDMYGKCGSIEEAERVFNQMHKRDVVTWNAMILGYVKCLQGQKALNLYRQMHQEHLDPNCITFVAVLNACASVGALEEGRAVHEEIIRRCYDADRNLNNCLLDMYGKCGSIEEAEKVFAQMRKKDVVTWNAMALGYVKCGEGQQALELYRRMQFEGVVPDHLTFLAILNACASVVALQVGRGVHEAVIQRGYEDNVFVQSSLVDMYGKCGSIEDAERVFKKMPTRDVVVWNAMLAAYGRHGSAKEALQHFREMCKVVEVNGVTFVSLLTACSHGGLLDDGLEYFKSMSEVYNISPAVEHYACLVDLLGRANHLRKAEELIIKMPMEPNASVWMSLLGACRAHANVNLGERCAKQLQKLEPNNAAGYVLLADIYAAAGKWESSARVHQERLDRGLKKTPDRTWIEVNNKVHLFVVDDLEHPQIKDIHAGLKRLSDQIKGAGFAPDVRFLLHCVDEERKEFHLCNHSEKLAIAFGLISVSPGAPVCIAKNWQVCVNCHTGIKFMTKILQSAIIVRDTNRIHHFKDGLCSCRDYW